MASGPEALQTIPTLPWKHRACWHLWTASELLRSLESRCLAEHFSGTPGGLGLGKEG